MSLAHFQVSSFLVNNCIFYLHIIMYLEVTAEIYFLLIPFPISILVLFVLCHYMNVKYFHMSKLTYSLIVKRTNLLMI